MEFEHHLENKQKYWELHYIAAKFISNDVFFLWYFTNDIISVKERTML